MNHNREMDKLRDEFFLNYRGRYSSFWVERWGLIPELPTSFDNANSIYELIAWLQRAFKQLLDDFVALEAETEDFKNAIVELLENLIPLLIRRYMSSKEADDWFNGKADIYYNSIIKPYIDQQINSLKDYVNNNLTDIRNSITNLRDEINGKLNDIENKIIDLQTQINKINGDISSINKEINNIKKMMEALKFMSSGQPPYQTIIADYQNSAIISLNPNPNFPELQGVGLRVASVQYETDDAVNNTTWLQINLGELTFNNIKHGDVLGRVSIAKLLSAGLQPTMVEGIERFTRLVGGITVNQRPVELLLSREGGMVKISYIGGFMQAQHETISGHPRTENVSPWVQISETPK